MRVSRKVYKAVHNRESQSITPWSSSCSEKVRPKDGLPQGCKLPCVVVMGWVVIVVGVLW